MGGSNTWFLVNFFQCMLFDCAECELGPEIQLKHKYPGLLLSRISSPNEYSMHLHNSYASTEVGRNRRELQEKGERCPFFF